MDDSSCSYIKHFGLPGPANATRVYYSFDILEKAIDNQCWPKNNLFSPFNLTFIQECVRKNSSEFILQEETLKPLYPIYNLTKEVL